MKKVTFLLFALLCVNTIYAQQLPAGVAKGNETFGNNRDLPFQCLPNPAFSQVFLTYDNAYWCDNASSYDFIAEDYTASTSFSTMRIWGGNFYTCLPGTSQNFLINFYDGNPCEGGVLIHSFAKTATITPLGIIFAGAELYQADINFGVTINLLNGWVSITRINPGEICEFGWLAVYQPDGNMVQHYISGGCNYGQASQFFCLGGELPSEVPIANWALIIGIALIALTAFIRFRKLI